jgi:cellobiose transport system permease protein
MSLSTTTTPHARVEHRGRPSRPGPTRIGRLTRLDLKTSPYLYIAPFFIIFGIFGLYPMVWTLWMSLHKWNLVDQRRNAFIGFDNYVELFKTEFFWNAVINTFGMFVLATVPQLLLALFLANLLNRPLLKAKTFWRLAVFVPNATSVAAVAIVFGTLFARDFGVVNWVLSLVGIGRDDPIEWHAEEWSSWIAISTMVDWRWTGYNALILLAGMQAIPRDLYESASIDGAGQWKQFWSITLPMLRPTFIFDNGSTLGGNQRQYQTITMYMVENSIDNVSRAGYGAAVAWSLFLMIILASFANYLLVRRTVR